MDSDAYKTVVNKSEGTYSELRSKFIGLLYSVDDAREAMKHVAEAKREYYDARHVTFAYSVGVDAEEYRVSDDGEPSGTAGLRILGQIHSHDLRNVLIIVVRYFGGVKLGTSRLAVAYRTAADAAIDNAEIVERHIMCYMTVNFNYTVMNDVMRIVRDCSAQVTENSYDNGCKISLRVRRSMYEKLHSRLLKIDSLSFENED